MSQRQIDHITLDFIRADELRTRMHAQWGVLYFRAVREAALEAYTS
jgi:hypothetical protein